MPARAGATLAAVFAVLGGCGGEDAGREPREASELERATAAIRDCRVRSVVSLHSGALFLELKDGGRIELTSADEGRISAAIEHASPRCGHVVVAME